MRLRFVDSLVLAYVAQVILFNPVVTDVGTVKVYLNTVSLLFLAGLQLITRPDRHSRRVLLAVVVAVMLLTVTTCVTSLLAGPGPNAVANAGRLLFLPISIAALLPSWRVFPAVLQTVVVCLSIESVLLLSHFASTLVNIVDRISPDGLGASNAFSMLLAVAILLRLQLWRHAKIATLGLLPILVITMLYTYSRGAVVSLLVGFVVWLLTTSSLRTTTRVAMGIVGALAVSLALGAAVGVRFTDLSLAAASGRSDIFQRAMTGFAISPIWGNGFGSFTNSFAAGLESAHNVYLQVAFESGVLGLLAAAAACAIVFRTVATRAALPVVAALAVDGLVDNHFYVVQYTWILAVFLAYTLWVRNASSEGSSPQAGPAHRTFPLVPSTMAPTASWWDG